MLPRLIYQLLPYFYIGLGLVCILIVESRLIFFSAALLIAAGGMVLWMRQRKPVDLVKSSKKSEALSEEELGLFINEEVDFPDHERRIGDERQFPLTDDNGVLVPFDRRNHEPDKIN
jgi:hypothetical protein